MPDLSIIIPTLNEAHGIAACLTRLQSWRDLGHEVIVVDGGSSDATCSFAETLCDRVLHSPPGRAVQMNHGAAHSRGRLLVFLHADTVFPASALVTLTQIARDTGTIWGRFDVTLAGRVSGLCLIAAAMNLRSRLTGIATGDQTIFVARKLFESVDGYRPIPLMEDIDLSARLRRIARPRCLDLRVTTSARRWEQRGTLRTILQMWWLRWRFYWGADPAALAAEYHAVRETP
jgi:rSAM/selenodomain-associated transferase 2